MTDVPFKAMFERSAPLRVITGGRTFQSNAPDSADQKVGYGASILCVDKDADLEAMKGAIRKVLEAVLGPVSLKYEDQTFGWFDPCLSVIVKHDAEWTGVMGCGVMTDNTLRQAGHDPAKVNGFAFTFGLERLAMLKYGIDDLHKLWQPPYVPEVS